MVSKSSFSLLPDTCVHYILQNPCRSQCTAFHRVVVLDHRNDDVGNEYLHHIQLYIHSTHSTYPNCHRLMAIWFPDMAANAAKQINKFIECICQCLLLVEKSLVKNLPDNTVHRVLCQHTFVHHALVSDCHMFCVVSSRPYHMFASMPTMATSPSNRHSLYNSLHLCSCLCT